MKKLITLLTALILLFTSAVLAEETFSTDEAGHPVFGNFGEARKFSQNGLVESDFYMILVAKENTFYRVEADYDETAKNLYEEYRKYAEGEDRGKGNDAFATFVEYCCTLPVKYAGEFTADPIEQEVLDELVGKTMKEAKDEGYTLLPYSYTPEDDVVLFELEKGLFRYAVKLNESGKVYQECYNKNNYDDLTIKSIKWEGSLSFEAYDYNPEAE